MSDKTLPQTTGIIATIRALLAAGWRNDSVYQAGGSTCREMLHPSGREITARTSVYGDDTSLTLTGLTLDQVAGAINGAGLAPSAPASDPRRVAYDLILGGVAAGLPIPDMIDVPSDNTIFELRMADNDGGAVDAWAAFMGLPAAKLGEVIRSSPRDFRNYQAATWEYPNMPGWKVEVCSYFDEPAEGGTR